MQTNGRFVQNVKNTTQIRPQLRGQSDPLRFAAAQRFRGTAEREITEPDIFHEAQALPNFGDEIGGNGLLRSGKFQFVDLFGGFARRKTGELIDGHSLHANVSRDGVQTRAVTTWTFTRVGGFDPFRFPLGSKFVFQNGVACFLSRSLEFLVPDFAESAAFLAGAVR